MKELVTENELYNDIVILPMRDVYTELNFKLIQIYQWIKYNTNSKIIVHTTRNMG